jgi:hypothetical protein
MFTTLTILASVIMFKVNFVLPLAYIFISYFTLPFTPSCAFGPFQIFSYCCICFLCIPQLKQTLWQNSKLMSFCLIICVGLVWSKPWKHHFWNLWFGLWCCPVPFLLHVTKDYERIPQSKSVWPLLLSNWNHHIVLIQISFIPSLLLLCRCLCTIISLLDN